MRSRSVVAVVVATMTACGQVSRCKGATCESDAGIDAGRSEACGGTCGGFLPVCDAAHKVCVTCTETAGCAGSSPVCDTAALGGRGACLACTANRGCTALNPVCLTEGATRRCAECARNADCPVHGDVCNEHRCMPDFGAPDAGVDAGATVDAGSTDADAGTDGGLADAGGVCIVHTPTGSCSAECPRGFHCQGNRCTLNGGNGPVQVTLRWDTSEDVDLHVIEPVGARRCDVYYGNNTGGNCGARGQLDLDSNAGCTIDNVDLENVIYDPDGGAPSGLYEVHVDHYSNCDSATSWVQFEVEARVNSTIIGYCGAFIRGGPGWDAHGGANSGTPVMTFMVP